uniref:Uncharacterized protein n=1 Tax=Anopheles culicifacies TaxID=139723 RepID=A0A182M679_9DIPT
MRFVADVKQQPNATERCYSESNVLHPKPVRYLRHQPIDRERYDEEQIQTDEGEGVTRRESRITGQLAKAQPKRPILGHLSCRAHVAKGTLEIFRQDLRRNAERFARQIPVATHHVGDRVENAVRYDLQQLKIHHRHVRYDDREGAKDRQQDRNYLRLRTQLQLQRTARRFVVDRLEIDPPIHHRDDLARFVPHQRYDQDRQDVHDEQVRNDGLLEATLERAHDFNAIEQNEDDVHGE